MKTRNRKALKKLSSGLYCLVYILFLPFLLTDSAKRRGCWHGRTDETDIGYKAWKNQHPLIFICKLTMAGIPKPNGNSNYGFVE